EKLRMPLRLAQLPRYHAGAQEEERQEEQEEGLSRAIRASTWTLRETSRQTPLFPRLLPAARAALAGHGFAAGIARNRHLHRRAVLPHQQPALSVVERHAPVANRRGAACRQS